ncbi:hypothetical protein JCM17844_12620 [Iodidimonas gelatinilytica]|uniref:SPOR domain-containing protein n=1 Tax=Iodidimonas gelatinilytica TaxID=1236966 RepID=A0A5A7MRJ8_9PROT|nr:SPOR domain-containing protein [Iodidimonas gelatinilytica]GEQ97625.1 hypothetical protein JCM17844_12620 [Iodidimonas gelatinilytica]
MLLRLAILGMAFCSQVILTEAVLAQETGTSSASSQDVSALDIGRSLYFKGDYQGAYAAWQPLVDAGDARALYNMSTLYRRGLGVDADAERALALLTASAEKGFVEAQYLLASQQFEADITDEAARQAAVRWWLAAARQGHALSQYRLGLLYWNGDAVARDLVRGHAWMRLAADQEMEEAQKALATMDRYIDADQRSQSDRLAGRLVDREAVAERQAAAVESAPASAAVATPAPTPTPTPTPAPASAPAPSQEKPAMKKPVIEKPVEDVAAKEESPRNAQEDTQTPSPTTEMDFAQSWRLQLVALRQEADVEAQWRRMLADAPDLLGGLEHRIVAVTIAERGTFYRLQAGPFASRGDADTRCRALKAAGLACFILSPGR